MPEAPKQAAKGGPVELIPNNNAPAITDLYGNNTSDNSGSAYTTDTDLTQIKSAMVPRVQVIRGDKTETLEFYRDTAQ